MSDLLWVWFKLAWVVFTECKQTSSVHVYDWTNEPGLRHRAVTSTFTLPTGIPSVLSRDFGIDYINNLLYWNVKIFILCVVRRICTKARNNPKQTWRKLNSIFNDLFSLFLCPPNCLYLYSCTVDIRRLWVIIIVLENMYNDVLISVSHDWVVSRFRCQLYGHKKQTQGRCEWGVYHTHGVYITVCGLWYGHWPRGLDGGYTIHMGSTLRCVVCDMDTDQGGWTVGIPYIWGLHYGVWSVIWTLTKGAGRWVYHTNGVHITVCGLWYGFWPRRMDGGYCVIIKFHFVKPISIG